MHMFASSCCVVPWSQWTEIVAVGVLNEGENIVELYATKMVSISIGECILNAIIRTA